MREMGLSVMVVTVYLAGYRVEPSCFDVVRAGVLRYWHDDEFFDFAVSCRFFVPEEEIILFGIGIAFKEQCSAGAVSGQFVGLCAAGAASGRAVNKRFAEGKTILFFRMRTFRVGADHERLDSPDEQMHACR